MSDVALHCDRAIYTSIRTPMGEGYRIVAASKGLPSQDGQAITRSSPSLDAICMPPDGSSSEPIAVAFYRLPSARSCVAYSCFAGEEHTGRGGRRVYTTNLVFDDAGLARCAYSPFRIIRAMIKAGLAEPHLDPQSVLAPVELSVPDHDDVLEDALFPTTIPQRLHAFVLDEALRKNALVVDMPDHWTEFAEAVFLGIPGPMRAGVSFSAGLHFSTSRKHLLQILRDDKGKAKARCATIGARFLSVSGPAPAQRQVPNWVDMSVHHWRENRLAELSRKTSRPYNDTSNEARERLAAMLTTLDRLPQLTCLEVMNRVKEVLTHRSTGAERSLGDELVDEARQHLLSHLATLSVPDREALFGQAVVLWRQGEAATRFSDRVILALVREVTKTDPLRAAQLALEVASEVPAGADPIRYDELWTDVLKEFAAWAIRTQDASLGEVPAVVARWRAVRPDSPQLSDIEAHCAAVIADTDFAR